AVGRSAREARSELRAAPGRRRRHRHAQHERSRPRAQGRAYDRGPRGQPPRTHARPRSCAHAAGRGLHRRHSRGVSEAADSAAARACARCMDRSQLLARIGARLEIRSRLRGRLFELLALDDHELLEAVGEHSFQPKEATRTRADAPARETSLPSASEPICHHDRAYPPTLTDDGAPRLLYVRGGADRLRELSSRPVIALCGSSRSTDYGIEMARGIAAELIAHGVALARGLADSAGAAALQTAANAHSGAIAALGGGHGAGCPAAQRALARQILANG